MISSPWILAFYIGKSDQLCIFLLQVAQHHLQQIHLQMQQQHHHQEATSQPTQRGGSSAQGHGPKSSQTAMPSGMRSGHAHRAVAKAHSLPGGDHTHRASSLAAPQSSKSTQERRLSPPVSVNPAAPGVAAARLGSGSLAITASRPAPVEDSVLELTREERRVLALNKYKQKRKVGPET